MSDGPRQIVVLDDHILRGTAISTLLAQQAKDLGLTATWTEQVPEECSGSPLFAASTAVCLYVIGGRSIAEPQVNLTLRRCLVALAGRPLVVLVDEIDAESIAIAIALEVRGVIPTRMPSEFMFAAIRFIQAGGHYYPHSISTLPGTVPSTLTTAAQNGAACRPKAIESNGTHILSWSVQNEPASGSCPDRGGESDDADCVGVQVGEQTAQLTPRQIAVMQGLERGLSNKAIGRELNLSESTVKLHVRHLMRKLHVGNRTQIAVLASSAQLGI